MDRHKDKRDPYVATADIRAAEDIRSNETINRHLVLAKTHVLQTRSILQSAARYRSMANGNFPYHTDQFHSFTYSPAFYSSGPSYSQNQQLPVFYPSQTDSQQFSQAFHPPQNDLQQFSAESEPSAGSTSKAPAKKMSTVRDLRGQ